MRRGCAEIVGLPWHLAGADEASAANLLGTGLLLSPGAVRRPPTCRGWPVGRCGAAPRGFESRIPSPTRENR
jgi:hypothetical protein